MEILNDTVMLDKIESTCLAWPPEMSVAAAALCSELAFDRLAAERHTWLTDPLQTPGLRRIGDMTWGRRAAHFAAVAAPLLVYQIEAAFNIPHDVAVSQDAL